jgi:RNA polymerase sigma-70 factor (ECF subfamily)
MRERSEHAFFETGVREALPRLLGTAYRLVGDGHVAEEVVAEALFRAWRRRDGFRADARVGTWLHRILCRVVADRFRARGRRRHHEQAHARGQVLRREPPAWVAPALHDELARAAALTDRLPERQRLIVLLHVWEGLTLDEVAATLGLRYATVKSNLHHARTALRAGRDADGTGPGVAEVVS